MKQSIILSVWLFSLSGLFAQNPCGQGRYVSPVFPEVEITKDVVFGENLQPSLVDPNARQTLRMDIYEPKGDTATNRPLLILAFGGAFVAGSRSDADISELCTRLAKLGYVTASIDYRVTISLIFDRSERNFYLAVMKAVHDMKAAVRYFRMDADSANLFRIDPARIIAGGISAGGVTGIHTAYLNNPAWLPPSIANDTAAIGGIEGLSGNPGYSSGVMGVINLCGAIGDTTWLNGSQIPIISVHGTEDQVVPYGSTTTLLGANLTAHGSASIHQQALRIGLESELLTFQGADHVPFTANPTTNPYMDSTVNYLREKLANWICVSNSTATEKPASVPTLKVYPQPAGTAVFIEAGLPVSGLELTIWDSMGRRVEFEQSEEANGWSLRRTNQAAGLYHFVVFRQGAPFGKGALLLGE